MARVFIWFWEEAKHILMHIIGFRFVWEANTEPVKYDEQKNVCSITRLKNWEEKEGLGEAHGVESGQEH